MNVALLRALAGESRASPEVGTEGHAPKEPRRRFAAVLWVYTQSTALVTTTRTKGARVVLTLPVTRKRLRGGPGPGRARAISDGFERKSKRDPKREEKRHDAQCDAVEMTRAEKTRAERTVVELLAALASKSLRGREKAPPAL